MTRVQIRSIRIFYLHYIDARKMEQMSFVIVTRKSEWDTRGFRGTDSRINQANRSESVRSVRSNSEKLLLYL